MTNDAQDTTQQGRWPQVRKLKAGPKEVFSWGASEKALTISHLAAIYVLPKGVFLRDHRPMRDWVRMIDEEPHKRDAEQCEKDKQA